jgi:hypothetical protein
MALKRIISSRRGRAVAVPAAAIATVAAVTALVLSSASAAGTSQAADKMVVQGSNQVMLCQGFDVTVPNNNCNDGPTALLTGTIKLSSPKNLVVEVTMDCSTLTDVTTTTSITTTNSKDSSTSTAEAASGVHAWLTLTPAGQTPDPTVGVIPIDPGGATNSTQLNAGDVTFCNHDLLLSQTLSSTCTGTTCGQFTQTLSLALTLNEKSESANGFNWVSLPDANTTQVETVTLWGQTTSCGGTSTTPTVTCTAAGNSTSGASEEAMSTVGQRTMMLTPANTAQNAEF